MPRKPNIIPSVPLTVHLPLDLRTKLDLVLVSKLEGRIPVGAYQRFFVKLLNDYFAALEPK